MLSINAVIDNIRSYNPTADADLILNAYHFAQQAHISQKRLSGESYIVHPLEISNILADLKMDTATIIAGLLHDVVEDTLYSYDDVSARFGKEVADLVDGVTKIAKLEYSSEEDSQTESFRKMFVAMANDMRVIIIKLADRLHNMRTLAAMSLAKQIQKSTETLDIYAPIAHRLGISKIRCEFEDLALRYLDPPMYFELVEKIAATQKERETYIENVMKILLDKLEEQHIRCDITGRPKHYYSIFRKIQSGKSFDEIYDLIAVRVLVDTVNDCYAALGWVHTLWKPIPGRIKDYIAMPKPNMYQSLHTTVIGPGGTPVEVQIRTWEMHQIAEYGVAAHWKYKEGKKGSDEFGEKLHWLWEIKELEQDSEGSDDFVDLVKQELYADEVFVFTPKGKVIELPSGATPIDFAYRIHTDVGHRCSGAKVNGKLVPLPYKLKTGDIVQIITSASSKGPSRDWLSIAASTQAKSKIRAYFRKADKEENIQKGRDLFAREIKHAKLSEEQIIRDDYTNFVCDRFNVGSWDDLFSAIGYGGLRPGYVIQRIKEKFKKDFPEPEKAPVLHTYKSKDRSGAVHVQGHSDLVMQFSRCCSPVPGDPIIGYITRGRGIAIHRADCINITSSDEADRFIEVNWILDDERDESFVAQLFIRCTDRPRLLADISAVIGNEGLDITRMQIRTNKDSVANMDVDIVVKDASQVEKLIAKLLQIPSILSIHRI